MFQYRNGFTFLLMCWLTMGLNPLATAALISKDYATLGDKGLTLDTDTGLLWLDFGYTRGLSISQVQSGAGGWSQQFRYATLPEVQQLFHHAGLVSSGSFQTGDVSAKAAFEQLFDSNNTACPGTLACAIFPHANRTLSVRVGLLSGRGFANILNYVDKNLDYAQPSYGHLLISLPVSIISEPPTSGLALGLVGLFAVLKGRFNRIKNTGL